MNCNAAMTTHINYPTMLAWVVRRTHDNTKNDHRYQHRTSNAMDHVLIVIDGAADDENQRNPQGLTSLVVNGRHSQIFVMIQLAEGKIVEPPFSGQCKFALCVQAKECSRVGGASHRSVSIITGQE